jgi:hypothetical protein
MSKYLVVERERLEKLHTLISNLPVDAMGEGSDGYLRWPIRDEVIDTINHCMHSPLPASAQFAGEMEEFIRTHFAEHEEVEDPWYSCPKIDDYAGPFKNGICLCGKDEADALLAKIKAAGEET